MIEIITFIIILSICLIICNNMQNRFNMELDIINQKSKDIYDKILILETDINNIEQEIHEINNYSLQLKSPKYIQYFEPNTYLHNNISNSDNVIRQILNHIKHS